ncbi:MAG: outer membrane beta-barrel protein [Thermoguttaceae bacterium]
MKFFLRYFFVAQLLWFLPGPFTYGQWETNDSPSYDEEYVEYVDDNSLDELADEYVYEDNSEIDENIYGGIPYNQCGVGMPRNRRFAQATLYNSGTDCNASLLGSLGCGGYYPAYGTIGNCGYEDYCMQQEYCSAQTFFGGGQGFLIGWLNAGASFTPNKDNYPIKYNDRGNEFVMNQLYLSAGRMVNPSRGRFDVGARVDLLYGTDYFYTSAIGLETFKYQTGANGAEIPVDSQIDARQRWNSNDGERFNGRNASMYGLSMPQLYAEFFLPIHCGMTIKAGHFYTPMGYESVMAPQNFFYSKTYTMMYGEPTTHTGVLVTQQISPRLAVIGGVTRGWDTWESNNNSASGLVGVQLNTCLDSTFAFTLHTGKTSANRDDARTNYSMVYTQQLNPAWRYVIQHDLGTEKNAAYSISNFVEKRYDATWVSIVQYLECQLTPACAMGLRFEWFQDKGNSRILQFPENSVVGNGSLKVQGNNYYDIALGMKWRPTEFLTIRPEVRWDWSDVKINSTIPGISSVPGMYNSQKDSSQCAASIDFILMF